MLQANRSGSSHRNPNYQTLLAFMPRQVLLAEKNAKMTTTTTTTTTMMKHCSSKTVKTLNPDQKARLLQSVLRYLEANGFSRALKRLLSEAQIENDHWKTCPLNLEDIYGKYLETCGHAEMKLDTYKEQEVISDGISNKHEDIHCSVLEKKNKSNYEVDDNAAANQPGIGDEVADLATNSMEILATDLLADANVELKKKKKSKKVSDSVHPTEQASIQVLKEPFADIVCELQMDESIKKQKDKKKKKSKSLSESLPGNVEQIHLDSLPVEIIEKDDNLKPSLGNGKDGSEVEVKSRVKKKKTKPSTNSLGDDVEHCESENKKGLSSDLMPVATENESKDSASPKGNDKTDCVTDGKSIDKKKKKKQQQSMDSLVENIEPCKSSLENMHGIPMEEKKGKSKEKKRKREDSVSETSSDGVPGKEDSMKSELKIESFRTSDKPLDKEKKSSKKRKTLASDENEGELVDRLIREKSKSRKTEPLKEANNTNTGRNENTGKESKGEDCRVDQSEFQNTLANQPTVHINGDLDRNGEKSAAQKTSRKQHEGSAEPKTVNAFQRVKLDEVQFADQRLQDNSYWAKGGAEVGYGAKAQEILGQVRGRDFRHEKTKKKRGSYKGGQIDLQTHSVKFNYSDDE